MAEVEVWAQDANSTSPRKTLPSQKPPPIPLVKRIARKWFDIQIESQGAYSVERLESFNLYCKTTSRRRAMLVCILTPVPALLAALLVELLPLRPPSEGWTANWVFWLRLLLVQLILGFTVNSQMIRFIPGLNLTIGKRMAISMGASIPFVGTCLLAAIKIGFPVPLMQQFAPIVIGIFTLPMIFLVLGTVLFATDSPLKAHADRYNRFFFSLLALCSAFPAYKLLFERIPVEYRGVAVIILPIWKLASKQFIVSSSRKLEDLMPVLVAFSVDFLSTLFIAACMSASRSVSLTLFFMAVNIGLSLLEFRAMSANGKALLELLDERRNCQTLVRKIFDSSDSTNLLLIILDATQNSASFPQKSLESVRLWACLPHPLTTDKLELLILRALDALGVYSNYDPTGRIKDQEHQQLRHEYQRIRSASITPSTGYSDGSKPTDLQPGASTEQATTRRNQRSKKIVIQGVQLLFHSEYVALVQYVEAITPMVFFTYKSVVELLPNVVYYPGGAGNWDMESVASVSLFAVMEVALLLSFNTTLRHKFGFSPLYQLAFVLETEFYVVQAILSIFIFNVLQYELEHFGQYSIRQTPCGDFTLRFKWLHRPNS
ncbi:hypothetical protein PF002_g15171 [Phytophthora fragariae]|uniref:Uncharacterized protein n=1 Tax=Phytophthora fragariae TaxID=53985 RepID=A0A6A3FLY0_9STRA|nr:hypothetical protein PF009_g7508 [Phytophthora fragariae]KAE8997520.1 hypothetical protein PF011_g15450 [Phytophthora fragariae]KAE9222745.1 hypothetical protein PF002_g15171 [Phytophthora fragariae]